MALRKSDLYSSLWESANALRGGMDASQYKDYVLTLLFIKYVSDKAKADPDSLIEVPDGGSFEDLVALKGKPDIGDQINIAIRKLADANDLQGVINNANFNDPNKLGDGKVMQERLSNLIGIFQDIDFSGSRAEGDDLLGDAYEYLMRHFATQSGKSKGQFYTPAEVSRVMAQLLQIPSNTTKATTVYDPTCGSGSLLIKVADAAPHGLTIYGQENDNATWALARMNMILHSYPTHDIRQGNTLADPKFRSGEKLDTFDFLVANPPFSQKNWRTGLENEYGRFDGYASPPEKNGDYAFLLHMVKSLKSSGRAAVVLPHGVLFRGNAEATIRKELIKRGLIKAIVGLPPNLFFGTGIPACIIVLDKTGAADRQSIFMVDASKGFAKDGAKNRLRPRDMHKIVDAYLKEAEIDRYSRPVPVGEIAGPMNEYNLNLARYIDSSEPEDIQDLGGHLQGGIPNCDIDALQTYWDAFPSLRDALFRPLRDGYSDLKIDRAEIQATIATSPEFVAFARDTAGVVAEWWADARDSLIAIDGDTRPADVIDPLAEGLLAAFRPRPLVDEYGVYEQLMSYWNDSMHDDVAMIVAEGWDGASRPRAARMTHDDKGKPKYEDAHLQFGTGAKAKRWVTDLIPPEYVVQRFFVTDHELLENAISLHEIAAQAVEEFIEEHAVEDGLLWEATDDDGKVSNKSATARQKEATAEVDPDADELAALARVVALFKAESGAKRSMSESTRRLDERTVNQYGKLTTDDVAELVVDAKWRSALMRRVERELDGLARAFVGRVYELGQRYERTLAEIDLALVEARETVEKTIGEMGAAPLLCGTQRLQGFTEPWRAVPLGEHVSYVRTVALSRAQLDGDSATRCLHYGDIHTSSAIYLDAARAMMPRARPELLKTAGLLQVGDLVFADASEDPAGVGRSIEISDVPEDGLVAGLHTIAARFDKGVLADGFKAYLQFIPEFRESLLRLAAGTKVLATTRSFISSITLTLPAVREQQAIVSALHGVNREIELSHERLVKSELIETSIRQELLTGRTRLPIRGTAT